jgi:RNA polymerase sigma-70 factor (ECF subfamily)
MPPASSVSAEIERIFREHSALVLRAAYRITGDAGDAEDVLQTVFLRLLRRPPEAAAVDNVESYLHRAAVNSALDLMRARQNLRKVPLDDLEPVLTDTSSPTPDRAHASGEIRAWLRRTVGRLSPKAAEIFALRFFEGKNNGEIAELLGTTQGTVAVTLSRTRDRIEKEFRSFMGEQQ